jgi:phospholipid transport system substrate-binding protein
MPRKLLLASTLLCCVVGAAQAQYYGPGPYAGPRAPVAVQQVPTPDALLRQGIEALTAYVRSSGATDKEQLKAFLESDIAPYFDFAYMAEWSGGRFYRGLNDAQKLKFQNKLKSMFLGTMVEHLAAYANQRIDYSRSRNVRGGREVDATVRLISPSGRPTNLTFRFYSAGKGWKVFDVSANHSSAVVYYRNMVNTMVRRVGPRGMLTWLDS